MHAPVFREKGELIYLSPSTGALDQHGHSFAALFHEHFEGFEEPPELCGAAAVAIARVLQRTLESAQDLVEVIGSLSDEQATIAEVGRVFCEMKACGISPSMLQSWDVGHLIFGSSSISDDASGAGSGVSLVRWLQMDSDAEEESAVHYRFPDRRISMDEYYGLLDTGGSEAYMLKLKPCGRDEEQVASEEEPFRGKPGPQLCVQIGTSSIVSWAEWQISGGGVAVVNVGSHYVVVAPLPETLGGRRLLVVSSANGKFGTCAAVAAIDDLLIATQGHRAAVVTRA